MQKSESILQKKIEQFIAEQNLITNDEKILLTVSGGIDSIVMTHLFSKTNYKFGIAHCNFSLRGKESDLDESFVEELANILGRPFHVRRFDTQNFADENKYSIQEAARILRYRWFDELSREFNYAKIATAHHLDDSIETFFINIIRGTGHAGLKGISVIKEKIIRPLLFATRAEIEEYALLNKIVYREDSSNAGDVYLRNRIRHHLIPVIKNESEGFEENMKNLMEDFSVIGKIIDDHLSSWKKKHVKTNEYGEMMIPLEAIFRENNPSSFLSFLLHSEKIKGVDCRKILSSETPGKIFHGGKMTILYDREFLILQNSNEPPPETIKIQELPAQINTGNLKITLNENVVSGIDSFTDTKRIQRIDAGKISLPLTLRTWEKGDYFFPLGMNGKKKISDFYTDEKIDRFMKDKIYLLLSGRDIVCILGHRIDDRYKITSTTRKILTIEFSNL